MDLLYRSDHEIRIDHYLCLMKATYILITFLSLSNVIYSQSNDIERIATYGGRDISLPEYDGMKEAYMIPQVKAHADTYEDPRNEVIAYYLNDEDYKQAENIDGLKYQDYFKIYANKEIASQDIDKEYFDSLKDIMAQQFSGSGWDEVKQSVQERIKEIEIGKPNLIKKYDLNENTQTYLCVIKISSEEEYIDLIMVLSIVLIKDKMLFVAYYDNYTDDDSIISSENKSNMIVNKLIKVNS